MNARCEQPQTTLHFASLGRYNWQHAHAEPLNILASPLLFPPPTPFCTIHEVLFKALRKKVSHRQRLAASSCLDCNH